MKTFIHLLILLGLTTSLCAQTPDCGTNANSIVIRFDPPSLPGGSRLIGSWTEQEFLFFATGPMGHSDSGRESRPFNGSAYINATGPMTIRPMTGESFALQSVDLSEYSALYAEPMEVTFSGSRWDGTSVSQSFTLDGVTDGPGGDADFQTFCFDHRFVNLRWVEVTSGSWQMDNLVVAREARQKENCGALIDDIVGWWRGESNALDSVGMNHGTLQPSFHPAAWSYGLFGAAFRMGATLIEIPSTAELDVGKGEGLTVEAWVFPWPALPFRSSPIVEWNTGEGTQGVYLDYGSTEGQGFFLANLVDDQHHSHVLRSPDISLTSHQWQHVALTYDKATGLAVLYLDGSAVTQTNLRIFTPLTTGNLYLGYRPAGDYPGSGLSFYGLLDEVTVYRRALSVAEVQCVYRSGVASKVPLPEVCVGPLGGILGWWRGESNVVDSIGGNNGQYLPESLATYTKGRFGTAFVSRRGTVPGGRFVLVKSIHGFDSQQASGLTWEAWLKPNESAFGSGILQGILRMGNLSPVFLGRYSTGALWARFVDTNGVSHLLDAQGGVTKAEQWSHVALTYDQTSGWAALYVDGSRVAAMNVGEIRLHDLSPMSLGFNFDGAMDEVAVYGRALTPFEINSIYSSLNGRCMEPPMITRHPESMRVNAGSDVKLSVEATGNPLLRHQWFKDGRILYNRGQTPMTNSSLELTSVTEYAQGTYHVVVTNAFGSAVSSNAVLLVNYPPVAVASAVRVLLVVPPCRNVVVAVLDGSRSSDPDDDLLAYRWFVSGTTEPVATGAVAVVNLSAVTHEFELMVDDGLLTDTNRVTVEVLTVVQALQRLIGEVVDSDWNKKQPLLASLNAAFGSISRDHFVPAVNQLEAFEHKVRAQVARKDEGLAASLREQAQAIITAILACDPHPGHKHGSVKAEHNNGKVKMEFEASNAGVFIIEASCDMIQWERIGVAKETESSRFGFADANAWRYPCRFYRIVTP